MFCSPAWILRGMPHLPNQFPPRLSIVEDMREGGRLANRRCRGGGCREPLVMILSDVFLLVPFRPVLIFTEPSREGASTEGLQKGVHAILRSGVIQERLPLPMRAEIVAYMIHLKGPEYPEYVMHFLYLKYSGTPKYGNMLGDSLPVSCARQTTEIT